MYITLLDMLQAGGVSVTGEENGFTADALPVEGDAFSAIFSNMRAEMLAGLVSEANTIPVSGEAQAVDETSPEIPVMTADPETELPGVRPETDDTAMLLAEIAEPQSSDPPPDSSASSIPVETPSNPMIPVPVATAAAAAETPVVTAVPQDTEVTTTPPPAPQATTNSSATVEVLVEGEPKSPPPVLPLTKTIPAENNNPPISATGENLSMPERIVATGVPEATEKVTEAVVTQPKLPSISLQPVEEPPPAPGELTPRVTNAEIPTKIASVISSDTISVLKHVVHSNPGAPVVALSTGLQKTDNKVSSSTTAPQAVSTEDGTPELLASLKAEVAHKMETGEHNTQSAPEHHTASPSLLSSKQELLARQRIHMLQQDSSLPGTIQVEAPSTAVHSNVSPVHHMAPGAMNGIQDGPAPQQPLMSAPVSPGPQMADRVPLEAVPDTVIRNVRYLAGKGDTSIKVRLIPESLGEMHFEVRHRGDEITVRLTSASSVVRDALEGHLNGLREAFVREGIDIHRVEVVSSMPTHTHSGNQPSHSSHHQGSPQRHEAPHHPPGYRNQPQQEGPPSPQRAPQHAGALNLFV